MQLEFSHLSRASLLWHCASLAWWSPPASVLVSLPVHIPEKKCTSLCPESLESRNPSGRVVLRTCAPCRLSLHRTMGFAGARNLGEACLSGPFKTSCSTLCALASVSICGNIHWAHIGE